MITTPKETIRMIANGRDYYFRFKTIDVIRNGQLLKKLTDHNCKDSRTTFRKGGPYGGIITKLDFAEEGMEAIQDLGIFRGMDIGFDMYLLEPWRWLSNSGPIHAIAYNIKAGGLDKIVIVAGDDEEAINVQVWTSDGYIVQLGDPMTFCVN